MLEPMELKIANHFFRYALSLESLMCINERRRCCLKCVHVQNKATCWIIFNYTRFSKV